MVDRLIEVGQIVKRIEVDIPWLTSGAIEIPTGDALASERLASFEVANSSGFVVRSRNIEWRARSSS